MVRYAPMAALVLAGVVCAGPPSSFAAELGCPAAPVEMERLVTARWPDLPARLSDALEGRSDIDGCARIAIRLDTRAIAPTAIVVEVVLRDGRSAWRSVSRAEDVIPTLEALLLLPEAHPTSPHAEAVAAVAGTDHVHPLDSRRGSATVELAAAEPVAPVRQPGRFRIELSLVAGARMGDGQTGVGLGVLTFFDVRGWLLGFEGAGHHYRGAEGVSAPVVLELAVLVGRRFRLSTTALDLTAGPAVALNEVGGSVAVQADGMSAGSAPPERGGLHARLVCGTRLSFRSGSLVRPFVGVDGELALESSPATTSSSPGEAGLPAWTAGVVVGVTVGTP
jgi:hypothetical protein